MKRSISHRDAEKRPNFSSSSVGKKVPKEEEVDLNLSLSLPHQSRPTIFRPVLDPPFQLITPPHQPYHHTKGPFIPPPYPWSTNRRAQVRPLHDLLNLGIHYVEGQLECKRCDFRVWTSINLPDNFRIVSANRYHTAPVKWLNPVFGRCGSCGHDNCMRPVVADKKRNINWLFMLLAQTIGVCTLQHLKYFCKHNRMHRTGSKKHLLFYTYLGVLNQLDPSSAP